MAVAKQPADYHLSMMEIEHPTQARTWSLQDNNTVTLIQWLFTLCHICVPDRMPYGVNRLPKADMATRRPNLRAPTRFGA